MQPRQCIVEIFSTFVQLDADQFSGWVTDPKLRRNMNNCLDQVSPEKSENFWALYWHKIWLRHQSPLAAAHMTAYLQEVCYWVARKMAMNFAQQSSVADFFQTAIARIHKVFKGFNSQYSSNLKSYAELAFTNIIKDSLRQRQEADICTDWALLHKLSRKRLVESLQYQGFNTQTVENYVLAWECFKELYAANDTKIRKLAKPDAATLELITHLYNVQRLSLSSSTTPAASPESLEKWLESCAKAVRKFLYPTVVSVDAPLREQETRLKTIGVYDPGDRTYSLESEDLIQDINTLGISRPDSQQIQASSPLPSLPKTQAEKLLERLGNPAVIFPRLAVPFQLWGALLVHSGWRQQLYERRQGLPEQWSIQQWLQAGVSHFAQQLGWEQQEFLAVRSGMRSQESIPNLSRQLIIVNNTYKLRIFSIGNREERIWRFELRNAALGSLIPAGFKLRLLTEDLQPFEHNEDTATTAIEQLYVEVMLEPGEGLVWEIEPVPEDWEREILRF